MNVSNQQVDLSILKEKRVTLVVKREDRIHPIISGNKYRKLKYNLKEAKKQGHHTLLTFGGGFSNHILAVACAGKEHGFQTIGVIRGEELQDRWQTNHTLKSAAEYGMQFCFVDRETYRNKETRDFKDWLVQKYGHFYRLPEGGTNAQAIEGCEEILTPTDAKFDVIAVSVGTGGTMAGLINSSRAHQKVLGFSALKGDFLKDSIRKFAGKSNWEVMTNYHLGGYAKVNFELIAFINAFQMQTQIPLDGVYTGKLFFGLMDMIKKDRFRPETKVLAIHTGGLQGNFGMNAVLKRKNLPLIDL